MLSSMGFHISSLSWSLLLGRSKPARPGKLDVLLDVAAMAEVLRGFQDACDAPFGGVIGLRWIQNEHPGQSKQGERREATRNDCLGGVSRFNGKVGSRKLAAGVP
jgi:hypothetical protein